MLEIKQSVGRGGKNRHTDVTTLQTALNVAIRYLNLKVDGVSGPETVAAIDYFQGRYAGVVATGLIEPQSSSQEQEALQTRYQLRKTRKSFST